MGEYFEKKQTVYFSTCLNSFRNHRKVHLSLTPTPQKEKKSMFTEEQVAEPSSFSEGFLS